MTRLDRTVSTRLLSGGGERSSSVQGGGGWGGETRGRFLPVYDKLNYSVALF